MMHQSNTLTEERIRVALVDDQQLVRGGFQMLIDSQPDLHVAAQAGHGEEALETLARVPVDVVLMDVRMPGMNGIEATERLLSKPDAPRVIVLTTFDLDEYVMDAIRAGASGFLLKDAEPEELLRAIRLVHSGDAVISPQMTMKLLNQVKPLLGSDEPSSLEAQTERGPTGQALCEQLATLTTREREVLGLVAQGYSNQEIGSELVISEPTVKTHVAHILQKTASRDRVQAVVFAYESGLVTP